jgi:hypothetical protein
MVWLGAKGGGTITQGDSTCEGEATIWPLITANAKCSASDRPWHWNVTGQLCEERGCSVAGVGHCMNSDDLPFVLGPDEIVKGGCTYLRTGDTCGGARDLQELGTRYLAALTTGTPAETLRQELQVTEAEFQQVVEVMERAGEPLDTTYDQLRTEFIEAYEGDLGAHPWQTCTSPIIQEVSGADQPMIVEDLAIWSDPHFKYDCGDGAQIGAACENDDDCPEFLACTETCTETCDPTCERADISLDSVLEIGGVLKVFSP